jgi:hypothetical protein
MSTPGGPGETAAIYQAVNQVEQFQVHMQWLVSLFTVHPELRAVSATVDKGHIDIIAEAAPGVLRDWIRALDPAVQTEGLYAVHYGLAEEDILRSGHATVHVRRAIS